MKSSVLCADIVKRLQHIKGTQYAMCAEHLLIGIERRKKNEGNSDNSDYLRNIGYDFMDQ